MGGQESGAALRQAAARPAEVPHSAIEDHANITEDCVCRDHHGLRQWISSACGLSFVVKYPVSYPANIGMYMEIDVYIESIGKTTKEWLVNFNYLKVKARDYNLELKDIMPFDEYSKKMKSSKTKYGDANNMSKALESYSFLNTAFVFEKQ